MTLEELAVCADDAAAAGCRVRVIVPTKTRPTSHPRCTIAPGLTGEVIDRVKTDAGYERHVLLEVADVRDFLRRARRVGYR